MFHSSKRGGAPARRRRTILVASLAAAAVATLAVACGEAPSALTAAVADKAPSNAEFGKTAATSSTNVQTLLWTKSVSQATVTKVIGPRGGELSFPAGMKLIVPRGAVSSDVTFQVTRLPGNIVAYDFEPHGTTFAVPLELKQPTLGTNLFKLPPATRAAGAYFLSASALNQAAGTADVAEFETTFVSANRAWITFSVKHFSGYLISTGRGGSDF